MFGMGKNDNYDVGYKYLTAACEGKVLPISSLGDTVYSTGILGDGYAVNTAKKEICSPVSGVVEKVSNNGHSFNIISDDGLKVLIHIGKDSDCDERLPTSPQVAKKDKVTQGQLICKINCDFPHDEEHCTVEVVVSNSDSLEVFELIPQNVFDVKTCVVKYK